MDVTDLTDILDRIYNPCSVATARGFVPPVGPRTLGEQDERWNLDCDEMFNVDQTVEEIQRKRVTESDVNGLMVAIVAKADDPALIFADDKETIALKWIMGTLKPAFQAMRAPSKKPWPEFLAALMNPSRLSRDDCNMLSTLFGVYVGHVTTTGDLVVPEMLFDAEFGQDLIDARVAAETSLGALVAEARGIRCRSVYNSKSNSSKTPSPNHSLTDLRARADSFAMHSKHDTRAVLASKLASREAALDAHCGSDQSPTSN